MKKILTTVCCLCMAYTGYMITDYASASPSVQQNALHAATIPSWNYVGQLPRDLRLDMAKELKKDTVVIHDTVTVNNTVYVRVPVPEHITDTVYIPVDSLHSAEVASVKNKSPGNSEFEENAKRSIVLIVDGTAVYSSGEAVNSEVSDEP